jgi:D-lactate dehydrogenase (cytochrome)
LVDAHRFAAIVGHENVQTDVAARQYFASDIFFWPDARLPDLVVAPATADEVAQAVSLAAAQGLSIVSRGGGMSYSGGYVPHRANTVLLDLRRLNRIRTIQREDQYVTIEAGATWKSLSDALADSGLRPVFKPPYSGIYSTVGGALSQGTADEMSGILGLEVVLANGEQLTTGSAAVARQGGSASSPFFRNFGPDMAGLFIADGGTLGVKTAATIALEPVPRAKGFVSFAYESFAELMRGMVACSQLRIPGRMMGLDPRKSQNAPRVGFKDAITTLASVAVKKAEVGGGLLEAMKMAAAGRNFMEGVQWSLHVTAEGVSERAVNDSLDLLRATGTREGREIPNLLPMALAAKPYSVRGFLGPEGERWVPTNAMIPYSLAVTAANKVEAFFASHRERMNALGIWESFMLGPRPGFVVLEPSFYWPDEVSRLQLDHLDESSAKRFASHRANTEARTFALQLRRELVAVLQDLGAVHVQLAKTYAYASRLSPAARDLWQRLRLTLDPQQRLNPDNLKL